MPSGRQSIAAVKFPRHLPYDLRPLQAKWYTAAGMHCAAAEIQPVNSRAEVGMP